MTVTYEIYLRSYANPKNYHGGIEKTALMMIKTFDKPGSKQSKVLPLMRDVKASGKIVSQLIRYHIRINSYRQETHWNHSKCYPNGKTDHSNCVITRGKKIPTLTLVIMPNQNQDYICYNCINYQHKRCKRLLMQESYHKEPCNCTKCWGKQ